MSQAADLLHKLKFKPCNVCGHSCTMAVDAWLDSNEDYHLLNNITADGDKTFVSQFHLRGEAKDWCKTFVDLIGTLNNKQVSWTEFKH